MNELIAQ